MQTNQDDKIRCIFCGGELILTGNANASDVCSDYEDDESAVVTYAYCRVCGRDYEIIDPPEDERNGEYSKYWNGE